MAEESNVAFVEVLESFMAYISRTTD
jgi:hypothetical protein